MAQRVQIVMDDDLDGGTADETVRFGLDGVNYEIDLSAANAKKLRDALKSYVASARRSSSGRRRRPRTRNGSNASEIREWARKHGHTVSDRGRVPAEVKAAYDAAH
jgi:hypothetical protein